MYSMELEVKLLNKKKTESSGHVAIDNGNTQLHQIAQVSEGSVSDASEIVGVEESENITQDTCHTVYHASVAMAPA